MHQSARTRRISVRKPRTEASQVQVILLPLVETGKHCLKSLLFTRAPFSIDIGRTGLHTETVGQFQVKLGLRSDAVLQAGHPIFSTPVNARHLGCGAGLAI